MICTCPLRVCCFHSNAFELFVEYSLFVNCVPKVDLEKSDPYEPRAFCINKNISVYLGPASL